MGTRRSIHGYAPARAIERTLPVGRFVPTVLALTMGVILGRVSVSTSVAASATAQTSARSSSATEAHSVTRPASPTTHEAAVSKLVVRANAALNSEAESAQREQQARELFGLVRGYVGAAALFGSEQEPEAQALGTATYLTGVVDGIMRVAPELTDQIGQEIEQAVCAPKANRALVLSSMKLIQRAPDLATQKGIDCVVSMRSEEDVVLWGALDAWQASGLPKSDALEELARNAKDPRTIERLDPAARAAADQASERAREEYEKLPIEERVRLSAAPPP